MPLFPVVLCLQIVSLLDSSRRDTLIEVNLPVFEIQAKKEFTMQVQSVGDIVQQISGIQLQLNGQSGLAIQVMGDPFAKIDIQLNGVQIAQLINNTSTLDLLPVQAIREAKATQIQASSNSNSKAIGLQTLVEGFQIGIQSNVENRHSAYLQYGNSRNYESQIAWNRFSGIQTNGTRRMPWNPRTSFRSFSEWKPTFRKYQFQFQSLGNFSQLYIPGNYGDAKQTFAIDGVQNQFQHQQTLGIERLSTHNWKFKFQTHLAQFYQYLNRFKVEEFNSAQISNFAIRSSQIAQNAYVSKFTAKNTWKLHLHNRIESAHSDSLNFKINTQIQSAFQTTYSRTFGSKTFGIETGSAVELSRNQYAPHLKLHFRNKLHAFSTEIETHLMSRLAQFSEKYIQFEDINHSILPNIDLKADRKYGFSSKIQYSNTHWTIQAKQLFNLNTTAIILAKVSDSDFKHINISNIRMSEYTLGATFQTQQLRFQANISTFSLQTKWSWAQQTQLVYCFQNLPIRLNLESQINSKQAAFSGISNSNIPDIQLPGTLRNSKIMPLVNTEIQWDISDFQLSLQVQNLFKTDANPYPFTTQAAHGNSFTTLPGRRVQFSLVWNLPKKSKV